MNPILDQLKTQNRPNQSLFDMLMANNPQFRSFVSKNHGKSPQQIAAEYGIDFKQVEKLINKK